MENIFKAVENFFQGTINGVSATTKIYNFIVTNLLGLVIGLAVGAFIILLIWFIIKSRPNIILCILILALTGTVGLLIHNFLNDTKYGHGAIVNPVDQVELLDQTTNKNWSNLNGGFTFEQIKDSKLEEDCPTIADKVIDLQCYDFGSYICFSYLNDTIYENIIFYKSSNGLILDGIINMNADAPKSTGFLFWQRVDLNSFYWIDGRNQEPHYFKQSGLFVHNYDNLVSISRGTTDFLKYSFGWRLDLDITYKEIMKLAVEFTALNATTKFIQFGETELIGNAENSFSIINTYYNHLYNQVKSTSYNTSTLIDVSNLMCVPIPSALQKNYPISENFKEKYPDIDYYGIYNCSIAINCNYKNGNRITANNNNRDYIEELNKDDSTKDKVTVNPIDSLGHKFSKTEVCFVNSENSNLSGLDLVNYPINIKFNAREIEYSKSIKITSLEELNNIYQTLLPINQIYDYVITSEDLTFEFYSGSFKTTSENCRLLLNYNYLGNYVNFGINLRAVGSIDTNYIHLNRFPVTIVLSNEKHTYTYKFDSTDKYLNSYGQNTYIYQLVEKGNYNYTILSEQLIFASTTGEIEVSNSNTSGGFSFAVNTEISKYYITYFDNGTRGHLFVGANHNISIMNGKTAYETMLSELGLERSNYESGSYVVVKTTLCDSQNNILTSDEYEVLQPPYVADIPFINSIDDMVDGETYTIQFLVSAYIDGELISKTLAVNPLSFTYDSTINYMFEFTF